MDGVVEAAGPRSQPAQVQVWKSNLTFELQTELCMRLSIDHSVVKSQDSGFPMPHINGTFITTHIIMNRVYFHFARNMFMTIR